MVVINGGGILGEVIVFEESVANTLLSLGFKYTVRKMDGRTIYVFIQTDKLMKYICSKFDKQSFTTRKTVCF